MPNSFTANLNLELPQVGADSNLWGGHLNSDLTIVDGIFTATSTRPVSMILKSDFSVIDATVTTKAIQLILSSITAATTRNLTVQDADGTLAYTAQIATATTGMVTTAAVAEATATLVALLAGGTFTGAIIATAAANTIALAGASTAVTQSQDDNSTKLATTAYVDRVGIAQVVSTITGAVSSGTTIIPYDDTIPQNTEGDQYLSLAITPKSATSTLIIDIVLCLSSNGAVNGAVALFQDSTANALAVTYFTGQASQNYTIPLRYVMTSGTTSATTFKIRAGNDGAGLFTLNGLAGSRKYGGSLASSITIREIGV